MSLGLIDLMGGETLSNDWSTVLSCEEQKP
jgi:hypothetical protein